MTPANSKILYVVCAGILVMAFLSGILISKTMTANHNGVQMEGILWPNPPIIKPLQLTNQYGEKFTLENFKNTWSLVFFGFANCPDICPMSLQAMTKATKALRAEIGSELVLQNVFISVDPERDTLPNLAKYASYFSNELIAVTGTPDELKAVARSFNTLFMKIDEVDNDYTIEHSSGIFFISPSGHMASVLTPPHNALQIAERFQNILSFYQGISDE
jgi:protein SCO1/2